jgi:hypothetical protein
MKALSLTQPWAFCILHLGKRIENRTAWKGCSYRGPILLHAAKSVGTREDFDATVEQIGEIVGGDSWPVAVDVRSMVEKFAIDRDYKNGGAWHRWMPAPGLLRGGIIGRARIVGVVREGERVADERQRAWWFGGFALVLADVEPLPFVPWKGALGLFEIPDDYAAQAAAGEERGA